VLDKAEEAREKSWASSVGGNAVRKQTVAEAMKTVSSLKAVVAGAVQGPLTRNTGEITFDGRGAGAHANPKLVALGAKEIRGWEDASFF
jgi:hypothetical protein